MNTHDNLNDPVVIDDDGITVDGKPLLVEKDSVSVLQDHEHGLTFVTLTLITDNLTIEPTSERARAQVTLRGDGQQ
ncbi:hypothetical protein [Corynebacterium sp. AOP12-C2-36]|uniref:hypothetical protein n=1 Tax=Corynebacterium sp. AOP12-C2-36 TaxID=3457723 RepID=UPI004034447E